MDRPIYTSLHKVQSTCFASVFTNIMPLGLEPGSRRRFIATSLYLFSSQAPSVKNIPSFFINVFVLLSCWTEVSPKSNGLKRNKWNPNGLPGFTWRFCGTICALCYLWWAKPAAPVEMPLTGNIGISDWHQVPPFWLPHAIFMFVYLDWHKKLWQEHSSFPLGGGDGTSGSVRLHGHERNGRVSTQPAWPSVASSILSTIINNHYYIHHNIISLL